MYHCCLNLVCMNSCILYVISGHIPVLTASVTSVEWLWDRWKGSTYSLQLQATSRAGVMHSLKCDYNQLKSSLCTCSDAALLIKKNEGLTFCHGKPAQLGKNKDSLLTHVPPTLTKFWLQSLYNPRPEREGEICRGGRHRNDFSMCKFNTFDRKSPPQSFSK